MRINNKKENIDPILQINNARNGILTAIVNVEEYHNSDFKIICALRDTVGSLNLIHRWFIRNPDVLPEREELDF